MQLQNLKNRQINSHNFQLQSSQRQAFLQIFNLYARNGKINKKDLEDIFERIGYYISSQHFIQLCNKIFQFNQNVTFEQFMEVFKIKNSKYNLRDIKNAFRLIAGDDDKNIPIDRIITIFSKKNIEQYRIKQLLNVLDKYLDKDKKVFNYKLFLQHIHS